MPDSTLITDLPALSDLSSPGTIEIPVNKAGTDYKLIVNLLIEHFTALIASKAPSANAALSGVPTAPTAAPGTNTTQLANTAFVEAAIAAIVNSAPGALNQLNELAAAMGNDANYAATVASALALKAALASPAFTGAPTAPTPAFSDDSTKISTTAFVMHFINLLDTTISGKANTAGPDFSGAPSIAGAPIAVRAIETAKVTFVPASEAAGHTGQILVNTPPTRSRISLSGFYASYGAPAINVSLVSGGGIPASVYGWRLENTISMPLMSTQSSLTAAMTEWNGADVVVGGPGIYEFATGGALEAYFVGDVSIGFYLELYGPCIISTGGSYRYYLDYANFATNTYTTITTWDFGTVYFAGDIVLHFGTFYTAEYDNSASDPSMGGGVWTVNYTPVITLSAIEVPPEECPIVLSTLTSFTNAETFWVQPKAPGVWKQLQTL